MFATTNMGQAVGAVARGLNSRWSSTGSNPPWLQGLHRATANRPGQPPEYAESTDRLRGVFRARRVVIAPVPEHRREQPLVQPDRQDRELAQGGHMPAPCPSELASAAVDNSPSPSSWEPASAANGPGSAARIPPRPQWRRPSQHLRRRPSRHLPRGEQIRQRTADTGQTLTLSQSAASCLATTTASVPAGSLSPSIAKASRSNRLTRLRSTAPPTFRDTDSPTRAQSPSPRGNTYSTSSRPACERPWRNTRSKSALRDSRTARPSDGRPARPSSDCQALATFVAPSLQREAARPCLHTSAESMGARAFALLRLVGTFHWLTSPGSGTERPVYAAEIPTIRIVTRDREPARNVPRRFFPRFASRPREPPISAPPR